MQAPQANYPAPLCDEFERHQSLAANCRTQPTQTRGHSEAGAACGTPESGFLTPLGTASAV